MGLWVSTGTDRPGYAAIPGGKLAQSIACAAAALRCWPEPAADDTRRCRRARRRDKLAAPDWRRAGLSSGLGAWLQSDPDRAGSAALQADGLAAAAAGITAAVRPAAQSPDG